MRWYRNGVPGLEEELYAAFLEGKGPPDRPSGRLGAWRPGSHTKGHTSMDRVGQVIY